MQRQVKKRQDGFINFFRINVHDSGSPMAISHIANIAHVAFKV